MVSSSSEFASQNLSNFGHERFSQLLSTRKKTSGDITDAAYKGKFLFYKVIGITEILEREDRDKRQ